MTPGNLRLEETKSWLGRARRDLDSAKLLLNGGFREEALFHCQQAAEKALKGFLTFHQRPFGKTHDLVELKPGCVAVDQSLDPVITGAENLTQYAWRFRYPGASYEPSIEQTADAIRKAEAVVNEIARRLA